MFVAMLPACSRTAPSPPDTSSSTPVVIRGNERLGWDQPAPSAVDLQSYGYALYVDDARFDLQDATCSATLTDAGYPCTTPLPAMSPGAHTLTLAAYVVVDDATLESDRSAPFQVTVAGLAPGAAAEPAEEPPPSDWANTSASATGSAGLRLELVASGLDHPTDIAATSDGRLFIAEASGRVRLVAGGSLQDSPALVLDDADPDAGGVLALTLAPDFDRSGSLYAVYAARSAQAGPEFRLARFRAAGSALVDQAIVLTGVRSRAVAAAAIRFAADGTLDVALDDGGDANVAGDLASPNGKVLRLAADGTTPRDQPASSPVFALPFYAPRGLVWSDAAGMLWVADDGPNDAGRLVAIVARPGARGAVAVAYALPPDTHPTAMAPAGRALGAAFRNNLLVATGDGRSLLRLWIDPQDATHVLGSERLLQNQVGAVRVVATAPDGATYFATTTALGRLVARPAVVPDVRTR